MATGNHQGHKISLKSSLAACFSAALAITPALHVHALADNPKKPPEMMKPEEMKKESPKPAETTKPATKPTSSPAPAARRPGGPKLPQFPPGSPEQVEQAIDAGKRHLYNLQRADGSWERVTSPNVDGGPASVEGAQWGGLTAIATYALLASGENPQSTHMKAAIDWLAKAEITGTYALGLRAQVWGFLPADDAKTLCEKDAKLLLAALKGRGDAKGFYHYTISGEQSYDHSCSQYGVLGIWACAEAGFEVPPLYWQMVEQAWLRDQDPKTGGWSYNKRTNEERGVTPAMTAAGVATLFITQDYVHGMEGIDCKGNVTNANIDAGIKYMAAQIPNLGANFYTWYGVERIGVASGYKYFGSVDWYQTGAKIIAPHLVGQAEKKADISDSIPNTAFSLLFLNRGRAPVAINKLNYEIDFTAGGTRRVEKDKPTVTFWNERPRDIANLVKYLSHESEQFLNWQVVNLQANADALHDAPILYIAGSQSMDLKKEDEEKLRHYVEQGGLIVCNADCSKPEFTNTVMRNMGAKPSLAARLFPGYEVRKLPDSHVIYNNQNFQRKDWKDFVEIHAVGNGAREFMLVFPTGDPAKYWQTRTINGREAWHQVMMDVFTYANGKETPRYKGLTYIVNPSRAIKAERVMKVARLEYAGQWDPEPGGWRRMAAILHNQNKLDLQVDPVKLGAGNLDAYRVAHLTGTQKFQLTDPQRKELKSFASAGGLLIIDAAGGNGDFSSSAEAELHEIYGDSASDAASPLKTDALVYSAANKIADVTYRQFAIRTLLRNSKAPRLRAILKGGKPLAYYSPEDLSVGMVGQEIDGIYGYSPASATGIMQNILVQASATRSTPGALTLPPQSTRPDDVKKPAAPPKEKPKKPK